MGLAFFALLCPAFGPLGKLGLTEFACAVGELFENRGHFVSHGHVVLALACGGFECLFVDFKPAAGGVVERKRHGEERLEALGPDAGFGSREGGNIARPCGLVIGVDETDFGKGLHPGGELLAVAKALRVDAARGAGHRKAAEAGFDQAGCLVDGKERTQKAARIDEYNRIICKKKD